MLTIGMLFWILFIIGFVFYGVGLYRSREFAPDSLLWWVLLFLLGIGTFGWPIR